ncbi:uncharacterized protein LOC143839012 isoform X2 [Paroedura picta]|uniref:uncharacterized protein LOC143839012 isoform X2 n=1 Tax=Paroedura picta TaxID=143630 RepID=UPI00405790B2
MMIKQLGKIQMMIKQLREHTMINQLRQSTMTSQLGKITMINQLGKITMINQLGKITMINQLGKITMINQLIMNLIMAMDLQKNLLMGPDLTIKGDDLLTMLDRINDNLFSFAFVLPTEVKPMQRNYRSPMLNLD